MPNLNELIAVFEDARRLVELPDNDFTWSSWIDTDHALGEIDVILDRLRSGVLPSMSVLFGPTGPMQELSLSSGWGDAFIALASRFDAALAEASCRCLESLPADLAAEAELGFDSNYGEVSLLRCKQCGRNWLRYFYEIESIGRSGRWYLGTITPEQRATLTADNAKSTLESLEWYCYGGSYFDGRSGRTSGAILL